HARACAHLGAPRHDVGAARQRLHREASRRGSGARPAAAGARIGAARGHLRVGVACARGERPRKDDVDALAHAHAACVAGARLAPHEANFAWVWHPEDGIVEAILGPIALSALTTLLQSDLTRVKQCSGEHCGWLFFDTTKNKRRRWCEMEVCGNRAK